MTAEPARPSTPGTGENPATGQSSTSGSAVGTATGAWIAAATAEEPPLHSTSDANPHGKRLLLLTLTALGVVYGDIGTSPLYAFKECFTGPHAFAPTVENVYGALSLIVWSLILIVSVKYIIFIMRADNRGEGGILALLALILQRQQRGADTRRRALLVGLALFGAALLYGDGIITPAISVLSAVEGLNVVAPALEHWVVALTVVIIFALFYVQRFGVDKVGRAFGPIMFVWFFTIAVLGAREIAREPQILLAISPWHGVRFFIDHGTNGFVILGSVVLAVTGAEALYADMGHFGKRPIRYAWFLLVFPALLLNYFGQGALLLRDASAAANPFYLLVPRPLLYPVVVLATLAAVIASQALISGAFSLTQQSMQLGYSPRMTLIHTSKHEAGQVYIPEVNKALAVGTILVVLGFRSSVALGAAYGIAVTGTMAITTLLFYVIMRYRWNWPLWQCLGLTAVFLTIDLAFLGANLLKIWQGGWVPLVIALWLFTLMATWKHGREILQRLLASGSIPLDMFLEDVARRKPHRVSGTAVFMTSAPQGVPVVLLHHLKHNKVLHQQVVLLSVMSAEVPEVDGEHRVQVDVLGEGFYRLRAIYGFMQTPDVKDIMGHAAKQGLICKPQETSYFLGRERLIVKDADSMARWRKKLFVVMSRNARSATEFFGIPPNRVVELGTQIEF
jgi:KUP system potassium uptake protein